MAKKIQNFTPEQLKVIEDYLKKDDIAAMWIYVTSHFYDINEAKAIPYMYEATIVIAQILKDQNLLLPSLVKPVETYLDEVYRIFYNYKDSESENTKSDFADDEDDEILH